MRFAGVQSGDLGRSCLMVKLKACIRGAAGGFSSFHLQGLGFVGVQIDDPKYCDFRHLFADGVGEGGPPDRERMRFEGVQSDELEHDDIWRLNGDEVREGGPLDGERDL